MGGCSRSDNENDDVLVKIEFAALNRADLMQREGDYPPLEGCPEWMGLEISGELWIFQTVQRKNQIGK